MSWSAFRVREDPVWSRPSRSETLDGVPLCEAEDGVMTTDADVESVTDVLGEPYLAETIPLPPDDEGEVVATLVRRTSRRPDDQGGAAPARLLPTTSSRPGTPTGGPSAATTSTRSTCASTAARCFRTRRPTTSPTCGSYFPEIDEAWQRVTERDGHTEVVISAHSTGGLGSPLWADEPPPRRAGRRGHELPLAGPPGQPPAPARRHPHRQAARAPTSRCARSSGT